MVFIAPKIIGGQNAPSPIGDLGLLKMTDALQLNDVRCSAIGTDFLLEGYLC
jgi:diaminohydroxyphosphoribosylaminopyrimidine deaminase/5-amino-6-(5-phosphoribosylamino)uracil reductase